MDFKAIQELLRFVSKSDLTEVELEQGDFKLKIKRKGVAEGVEYIQVPVAHSASAPATATATASVSSPASAEPSGDAMPLPKAVETAPSNANHHTIKSPMIGTFYRSPAPDKPMYVNVGDSITAGQTICIVEAMKLFNEIESEVSGRIVKILVESAQPVEYDQPLFVVELSK